MSGIETGLMDWIANQGFSIAVAVYLLYERTKAFTESKAEMAALNAKWEATTNLVIQVVKDNSVAQTNLQATIEKLCQIVNGDKP